MTWVKRCDHCEKILDRDYIMVGKGSHIIVHIKNKKRELKVTGTAMHFCNIMCMRNKLGIVYDTCKGEYQFN